MGWTSNHSGSNLESGTTRGGRSAVDFHVAEAVDLAQLVSGKIPKSLFLSE